MAGSSFICLDGATGFNFRSEFGMKGLGASASDAAPLAGAAAVTGWVKRVWVFSLCLMVAQRLSISVDLEMMIPFNSSSCVTETFLIGSSLLPFREEFGPKSGGSLSI